MNKTRPKQLSFRVNEEEYQQLQEKVFQRVERTSRSISFPVCWRSRS